MTSFTTTNKSADQIAADLSAVFMFTGEKTPAGIADKTLRRELTSILAEEGFEGKTGQCVVWHSNGRSAPRRYVVVGLGKREKFNPSSMRDAVAIAARKGEAVRAKKLAIQIPGDSVGAFSTVDRTVAVVEGVVLGTYKFDRYINEASQKSHPPEEVVISSSLPAAALKDGIRLGTVTSTATILARDLVTEPAGVMTPTEMAKRASAVARANGLGIKILEKKDLERLGMGAFLGVNAGSDEPPKLIHLIYRPKGVKPKKRVALVGKGITFDSGGLNLKPTGSIETMKCDMSGSAAVLSAMSALPELNPAVEVHGFMAMTENMPGGNAYKPGDVLRTMKGKTIEVNNTDAEGRLVLCDALAYAQQHKPDIILDLATLTGACVVALGPLATGVMGNDKKLVDSVVKSADEIGEKMWPLPLYDEYLEMMNSDVADMQNSGGRWGGAITAGLFLQEFVDEKVAWAHLDIAGPAFADKEIPLSRKGGTGAGVRTLIRYLTTL